MTRIKGKSPTSAVKALFSQSTDGLRDVVRTVLQEVLEAEMTAALGAATCQYQKRG